MDAQVDVILEKLHEKSVRLVCVGASAGAIDILNRLLPAVSVTCRLAITVLVHLPADRESLLASLFQARCALPVEEAYDKLTIAPAHIYFAPPSYHLLIERTMEFSLSTDPPVHYSRPSIDVLFESAADALGPQVLGIVLTGANQDGAGGLKSIYEEGGVVAVQRPCEAEAAMMPESALAKCPAAFSLSTLQLVELFSSF